MKAINPTQTLIASLQSMVRIPHASNKLAKCEYNVFLTNKYSETLWNHQPLIQTLKHLKNVTFIENYRSALSQIQKSNDKLILIVGDPHHHLHEGIKNRKFITLQEMCGLFPEKVPLSYRSRDVQKLREKLQARLQMKLDREPEIKHILITSHDIKMWDEAIQVLLDLHPADIIVEYEVYKQHPQFHALSLQDFLAAFKTTHDLIIPHLPKAQSAHEAKIIDFNSQNLHLKWIIEQFGLRKGEHERNQLIEGDLLDHQHSLEGFTSVNINEVIV